MTDPTEIRRPNRDRPEPLWHQAETALRGLIESGQWTAGSQIPNEDRLSEMLGISRITLRHALRNLEDAGMLRRDHGRGTFVRSATMVAGVRGLTSFTDEMRTLALEPGSRLLAAKSLPANEIIAEALEIAVGEPIVQLRRLWLGSGLPIGIQTTHLPAARVGNLLQAASEMKSLYNWLRENCSITPFKAKEIYRVGRVSALDAEVIEQPVDTPAFEVERVTFDCTGPFEFALSVMRADRYEIRSTLSV